MNLPIACHEWLVATCYAGAQKQGAAASVPFWLDAHRNRRGPFTAAGDLIRAIIDDAAGVTPDLVAAHLLTLLSVAPEISRCIDVPADVRQALIVSREGNPPSWTNRIANGVADFILGYFEGERSGRMAVFTNVDDADPTDQEFISVLLLRAEPGNLRLCICTGSDRLDPPLAAALEQYARRRPRNKSSGILEVPMVWAAWLAACGLGDEMAAGLWRDLSVYTHGRSSPPRSRSLEPFLDECIANLSAHDRDTLARAYVNADGTSHRVLAEHVYRRLPASGRKAMHMARAASLVSLGEPSFSLGAIPFHHEQAGDDAEQLLTASRSCLDMAWYDAALDWSVRGRRMLSRAPHGKTYGDLTRNLLFALLLLGRYDEVAALCQDLLSQSEDPSLLAHATYAMAILNARLYERSRQDYDAAKAWIEKSQKFTESMPASPTRAVNVAFLMNTLALVEMRKGRPAAAQQRLVEAVELMARSAPELYRTESVILWHNMARLCVATGCNDLAIGHLSTLLSQQPSDSAAWFDRGLIHQRAGRHEAALSDYDMAIRWEPAHVEAHFNRAQMLAALDRNEEAIVAYGRVLVLQPDFVDARLNRAILLRERGDLSLASNDIAHALRYRPNDARALRLQGLIEMAIGHHDAASDAFTRSVEADPSLADPWANRAIIAIRRGDLRAALHDLTKALALREDAAILYNRGRVFEQRRQWQKAADDYSRALVLDGGNREAINRGYKRCLEALSRIKSRSR
ncbi:tetratricopeptide repeat protein [Bradyrhizobium sp. AZCC 2289]|uniref:tetratricopeptide repeat protein n=1 Tax=Bradyrhizobium sp. AZCC 2289 TaxID=3117026 RepID=UPI002FF41069